jgi:hypothetical protein
MKINTQKNDPNLLTHGAAYKPRTIMKLELCIFKEKQA